MNATAGSARGPGAIALLISRRPPFKVLWEYSILVRK